MSSDRGDEKLMEDNTKDVKKESEYTGICGPCKWFKADPCHRWQFAFFLLFGCLDFIWLIMFFTSPTVGFVMAGICAIIMSLYGANHFRILLGLKEEVDKMAKLNKSFRAENAALKIEVNKLENARKQLTGVEASLKESNKKLKDNLTKFRQLDENLKKLGGQNIAGLERLQEQSQKVMGKWKESLIQHEKSILQKVYDRFEGDDGNLDMSKDEFKKFVAALPDSYQQRMRDSGKTFEDFAGDDGQLDIDELRNLLNEFAEGVASEGGSQ
mmetsp:Transcript_73665/g.90381  ORF Transcript_73665/g.90381 Transcript_73665/m.90381 type:complete len:270 (-) Transcript_73665:71-880(-)